MTTQDGIFDQQPKLGDALPDDTLALQKARHERQERMEKMLRLRALRLEYERQCESGTPERPTPV